MPLSTKKADGGILHDAGQYFQWKLMGRGCGAPPKVRFSTLTFGG